MAVATQRVSGHLYLEGGEVKRRLQVKTAIPPLNDEGINSAAAGRNFFLPSPFQRKRNLLRGRRISALRGQLFGGDFMTFQIAVFSHSNIGGGKLKRLRRLQFSSGNEKKEFPITPS